MMLYRHGDRQEPSKSLLRAVHLRPDYPEAQMGIAELAIAAQDYETAQQQLDAVLAAHPESVPAMQLNGVLMRRLGEAVPEKQAECLSRPCGGLIWPRKWIHGNWNVSACGCILGEDGHGVADV